MKSVLRGFPGHGGPVVCAKVTEVKYEPDSLSPSPQWIYNILPSSPVPQIKMST